MTSSTPTMHTAPRDHMPTPATSRRRALSVALLAAGLAACGDQSPVAPDAAELTPLVHAMPEHGVMLGLVDDATSRLLTTVAADSPVLLAFHALHDAVRTGGQRDVLEAVHDAELALAFSQAAYRIDAADRDALALQLSVIRGQLAVSGGR